MARAMAALWEKCKREKKAFPRFLKVLFLTLIGFSLLFVPICYRMGISLSIFF